MALIVCKDCGHKVSDMALACPQCARPVEARRELRAASEGARVTRLRPAPVTSEPERRPVASAEPPPVEAASSLPTALVAWQGELRVARESTQGVAKHCLECGIDVALDGFRARAANGYLCGDCQDRAVQNSLARQFWIRSVITKVLIIAALTAVVGVTVALVSKAMHAATLNKAVR
jgi:hypothetical protein